MNYTEKLYECVGGIYFDTGKTTEDWDKLERQTPINPPHYKDGFNGQETIESMVAIWGKEKVATYCEMSAFKYRARAGKKDPAKITEDINKAMWFENKAKELKSETK